MKPHVFVTRKIPGKALALLRRQAEVRVYPHDRIIPRKELLIGVRWCDALLCLLTDKINRQVLKANPRLKIVANYAVGYDNIEVSYAKKKGIVITNTPGTLEHAVAEHAFALLLAAARNIPQADAFMRAGRYRRWEPLLFIGTELQGKILGIVGLGRIGAGVAQRAAGMGMKVQYYDVRRNPEFEKKYQASYRSLKSLLLSADFVSLHVPLLPSTRHLIGTSELSWMKKSAYLINTSRGAVVDEKALVAALRRKQIAGAALDVYEREPKLTSGLTKLPNVILTPHIASATIEARTAMSELAARNILAVLQGKKALTPVN